MKTFKSGTKIGIVLKSWNFSYCFNWFIRMNQKLYCLYHPLCSEITKNSCLKIFSKAFFEFCFSNSNFFCNKFYWIVPADIGINHWPGFFKTFNIIIAKWHKIWLDNWINNSFNCRFYWFHLSKEWKFYRTANESGVPKILNYKFCVYLRACFRQ